MMRFVCVILYFKLFMTHLTLTARQMGPKKTTNTSSMAAGASSAAPVLRPFDTTQLNPVYAMVSARK